MDREFRIAETLKNEKRFFISNYGWIIYWNENNWFIENIANVRIYKPLLTISSSYSNTSLHIHILTC